MSTSGEPRPSPERPLRLAVAVTALVFGAELAGGFWTHSLALLSDAVHVFLDLFALGLSYAAVRLARRPADHRHTYGFHRAESLAALLNGLSLLAVSGFIGYEAILRLLRPEPVKSGAMLVIAAVGLGANLVVAGLLQGHQHGNLNVRSAFLHVFGDCLSSVAVIVGGVVMWFSQAYVIDPVLSIGISIFLFLGTGRIVREAVHVLIEGTPQGLELAQVAERLNGCAGVADLHDLHVWTLGTGFVALSAHVVPADYGTTDASSLLRTLRQILSEEFDIHHVTLQFEGANCGQGTVTGCRKEPIRPSAKGPASLPPSGPPPAARPGSLEDTAKEL